MGRWTHHVYLSSPYSADGQASVTGMEQSIMIILMIIPVIYTDLYRMSFLLALFGFYFLDSSSFSGDVSSENEIIFISDVHSLP